jgi:excisionase family DNA binding protein
MKKIPTMSVQEAARMLGCTLKWVYDMLYCGRLPGTKNGRYWRIPRAAVNDRLKAKEVSNGTPGR